ncbi:MAG: hypothetical protein LUD12_10090 [Lachnospiraceae bacterium]|nr:hypothetical protein [Lachnospiraceae bacterium]
MISWIGRNWYLLVAAVVVLFVVVTAAIAFLKLPTSTQITALKEWLKYAVTLAEKELGSGTGQLKLRMVYDMFVEKFSWLAGYISFDTFSTYVDEALEWMKGQLSSNTAISTLVSGAVRTESNGTEEEI